LPNDVDPAIIRMSTGMESVAATPRMGNVRAYVAGTGATGALIAGAVIVFLSAAAFVAFNGFSFPGGADESSVAIGANQKLGGAPELAAASLGRGAGAVARRPTFVGGPGAAGGPGGTTSGGPGSSGSGDTSSTGVDPSTGGAGTTGTTSSGPISNTVQDLDQTTDGVGLPDVSPVTQPITDQVDNTVNNTLNDAGGLVGNNHLGDQVGDTLNNTTNNVLGNGGLLGGGGG
jgi:hypothetical protein